MAYKYKSSLFRALQITPSNKEMDTEEYVPKTSLFQALRKQELPKEIPAQEETKTNDFMGNLINSLTGSKKWSEALAQPSKERTMSGFDFIKSKFPNISLNDSSFKQGKRSAKSYHTQGLAMDINTDAKTSAEILRFLQQEGHINKFAEVGILPGKSGLHIAYKPNPEVKTRYFTEGDRDKTGKQPIYNKGSINALLGELGQPELKAGNLPYKGLPSKKPYENYAEYAKTVANDIFKATGKNIWNAFDTVIGSVRRSVAGEATAIQEGKPLDMITKPITNIFTKEKDIFDVIQNAINANPKLREILEQPLNPKSIDKKKYDLRNPLTPMKWLADKMYNAVPTISRKDYLNFVLDVALTVNPAEIVYSTKIVPYGKPLPKLLEAIKPTVAETAIVKSENLPSIISKIAQKGPTQALTDIGKLLEAIKPIGKDFTTKAPITEIKTPEIMDMAKAGAVINPAKTNISFEGIKNTLNIAKYYLGNKQERLEVLFGKEKGKEIFQKLRLYDRQITLMQEMVEKRNKEIFKGVPGGAREYITDVLKGIKGLDEKGNIQFGAIQPSGTVPLDVPEKIVLPDGRVTGKAINDTERMTYRAYNTEQQYLDLKNKYPKAISIIKQYLNLNEEIAKTKLGNEIPAFSREILKKQYDITTGQPEGFSYVPSVPKEKNIVSKFLNVFKAYTASGRKFKTGQLAESGMEEKDILKTLTLKQQEFGKEKLHNNLAANILSMNLEPIEGKKIKEGYVKLNINHPRITKIIQDNKELFEEAGIMPDEKSLYQYPNELEKEFKFQSTTKEFSNPQIEKARESLKNGLNKFIYGITTNYLIRPSTTVRNAVSGLIQYNLKVLTSFYEGLLGKGFGDVTEDIKSLGQALTPKVIKELPRGVLGGTFYSDILGEKSIFKTALKPFSIVEYYFKRASFNADLNKAANKFMEIKIKEGMIIKNKKQFIDDFKKNYFIDMFQDLSDNADSVTFDYWNKPYILEKIPKSIIPFPNYYYHKWRMYSEYSPLALGNLGKGNNRKAIAKMLAGLTMFGLAWQMSADAIKKRKKNLEELALKKIDIDYDTTGRMKFNSDDKTTRYLRVYDWPILGDIMYYREMVDNNADLGDYLTDGIALGPALKIPSIMLGLRSKYEQGKPTSTLLGQQVAGWVPFSAYLRYMRVLTDPVKRRTYSKDYNAFQNFMNPLLEVSPISKVLEPQVYRTGVKKGEIKEYDISSETLKLLFLNIKSINNKEFKTYVDDQFQSGKVQRRQEKLEVEKKK